MYLLSCEHWKRGHSLVLDRLVVVETLINERGDYSEFGKSLRKVGDALGASD